MRSKAQPSSPLISGIASSSSAKGTDVIFCVCFVLCR